MWVDLPTGEPVHGSIVNNGDGSSTAFIDTDGNGFVDTAMPIDPSGQGVEMPHDPGSGEWMSSMFDVIRDWLS